MTKLQVTEDNRIIAIVCDTKDCTNTDVWICPGGTVACTTHLPKETTK
jgi:hypothetical protein